MLAPYSSPHARFQPKRMGNLRPCMALLIGKVFNWEYAGTSADDEAFPGQTRWMIAREHDADIPEECRGRWTPEEDLQPIIES